jgi:hypothetical protein
MTDTAPHETTGGNVNHYLFLKNYPPKKSIPKYKKTKQGIDSERSVCEGAAVNILI